MRALLLERAAARARGAAGALEVDDGTISDPSGARRVSYWELAGGRPLAPHGDAASSRRSPPPRTALVGAAERQPHRTCARSSPARRGSSPDLAPRAACCTAASCVRRARRRVSRVSMTRPRGHAGRRRRRSQRQLRRRRWPSARSRRSAPPRLLRAGARWSRAPDAAADATRSARGCATQPGEAFLVDDGTPAGPAPESDDAVARGRIGATYTRPYLMHGSIGPSAALALWQDGAARGLDAQPGRLRAARGARRRARAADRARSASCTSSGAGCYGHNGADDAAFDAALLAIAAPGRARAAQVVARRTSTAGSPTARRRLVELRARARRRRADRRLEPRRVGHDAHLRGR